jgi:hypothetical protein
MDKGFSTLIVPVQEHFLRSTRHQLSIPDEKPGLGPAPAYLGEPASRELEEARPRARLAAARAMP